LIEGVNSDARMVVDEEPDSQIPPYPTEKDEELLEEVMQEAQVPSWETQVEELLPQTSITEMKPSESIYHQQISFEEAKKTILKNYVELPASKPKEPVVEFDMDKLLFETIENLAIDSKVRPPMAAEDLLTLFTFKNNYGVAIPSDNSSGYENKSLINDLLILRLPALHTLFGGERILDHEIRVQEELASLQKGRKREKERDSGQGKAPVKMSAAKLAKKRAADIAAGKIPADEVKMEDISNTAPDASDRGSEPPSAPPSVV
jgi:hypothetical protein